MQSRFKILGQKEKLTVGLRCSITREPWPFFDVKGGGIDIWDDVTISSGVYILTHTHQFNKHNWRELDEIISDNPTVIENYAFIGINVIILPSCKRIGKHSAIGAGAVVTQDVPAYEIWAGNPAKKIGDVDGRRLQ
jgi:acetyltransferase-like isoleucine patch superfamily enzyme